jgi:hypothetical protein
VHAVDVPAHLFDDLADVRRANERGRSRFEHLSPPCLERGTAAHRVLERGSVSLHGVRRAGCTTDSPTQEHVKQGEVSRCWSRTAAAFASTRHRALARTVLEQLDAIALVVVEHEGRQKATDVGPHDRASPRS